MGVTLFGVLKKKKKTGHIYIYICSHIVKLGISLNA